MAERTSTEGHLTQQLQQMDTGMRASSLHKQEATQQNTSFNLPSVGSPRLNEEEKDRSLTGDAAVAVPPASSPVEATAAAAEDDNAPLDYGKDVVAPSEPADDATPASVDLNETKQEAPDAAEEVAAKSNENAEQNEVQEADAFKEPLETVNDREDVAAEAEQ